MFFSVSLSFAVTCIYIHVVSLEFIGYFFSLLSSSKIDDIKPLFCSFLRIDLCDFPLDIFLTLVVVLTFLSSFYYLFGLKYFLISTVIPSLTFRDLCPFEIYWSCFFVVLERIAVSSIIFQP